MIDTNGPFIHLLRGFVPQILLLLSTVLIYIFIPHSTDA
jgi:hypothetical protein